SHYTERNSETSKKVSPSEKSWYFTRRYLLEMSKLQAPALGAGVAPALALKLHFYYQRRSRVWAHRPPLCSSRDLSLSRLLGCNVLRQWEHQKVREFSTTDVAIAAHLPPCPCSGCRSHVGL